MTPLDAMKKVAEVLLSKAWDEEQYCIDPDLAEAHDSLTNAIAELESAEPVAWMIVTNNKNVPDRHDTWLTFDVAEFKNNSAPCLTVAEVTPLYSTAQSRDSIIEECAEVCDALRQEWARLKVGAYDGRYDMMEEAATVCEDSIRALKGK